MLTSLRNSFEKNKRIYESVLLKFKGTDGYDVYNCSAPFLFQEKLHLFGRIEKREEWAESRVRLFTETAHDEFTLVSDQINYMLEDPFVSKVNGRFILGGTQVIKNCGKVTNYYCNFYRGSPEHLFYTSCGPDKAKYVRLVSLGSGGIGVFSTYNTKNIYLPCFTTIKDLDDLKGDVIVAAKPVDPGAFGDACIGVHQAYLLSTGEIGCIGHMCPDENAVCHSHGMHSIVSFVYDSSANKVKNLKLIGTRDCFPKCPPKASHTADCVFSSGIVMRLDGRCDLYSGIGDTHQGRLTIDYPFQGHGSLVEDLYF